MAQPKRKILSDLVQGEISSDEYFEIEETAEYKSEYYHGEIFAMSGASVNHNLIAMNISAGLYDSLRNSDCFVFPGDIKVQVAESAHYVYPDVSVVCGEIEYGTNRDDIITNPVVIIEILSESTKDYDKGSKFQAYRKIRTLRDYILIDQYAYHVEYFSKNELGKWMLDEFENLNDLFTVKSINVDLPLNSIYFRVKLTSLQV